MAATQYASSFSPDYSVARRRFRSTCAELDIATNAYPHSVRGPRGEKLSTDVARIGATDAERVVVLSSALHGVEGFFGSAVQLALLEAFRDRQLSLPSGVAVLMIHALNPWGFAWLRRADSKNIDSNRNFLLPDEDYEVCAAGYRRLNALLNPAHPPRRVDMFTMRALWQVIRQGMPTVKQAIAGGQHEFNKGLFYGGNGPGAVHEMLATELVSWVGPAKQVLHFDFHTGLGPWATYRLLVDYVPTSDEQQWLDTRFGADRLGDLDPRDVAYEARGGIGRWCRAQMPDVEYLELCAEFGTYRPLAVLRALRAENQSHHWSRHPIDQSHWTKRNLLEAFCPRSNQWRKHCVEQAVDLVQNSIRNCD